MKNLKLLIFRENVAFRFNPIDDLALGHGGAESRHKDLSDLGFDSEDPPVEFGGKCGRGGERIWKAPWEKGGDGGIEGMIVVLPEMETAPVGEGVSMEFSNLISNELIFEI